MKTFHIHSWRWCWGCLRPRRFREAHWPPLDDGLMRWRRGYFVDGAGHVNEPSHRHSS